ncbi:MAG: hypothetical protein V3V76_11215 [Candidatus Adiutricales bacterium]
MNENKKNSLNLKLTEIKIKNTKYTSIIMVISFLTLLTMVRPMAAQAAGTYSIKPSIQITGDLDSNSGLTPADESEEYILIIKPSLIADYASPRLNWSLNTNLAFRRYANNKRLNADFWRGFSLGAGYIVSTRSDIKTSVNYLSDKAILPEPEETGLSTALTNKQIYSLSGTFSHKLSERSGLNLSLTYSGAEYDFPGYVGRRSGKIGLAYNRQLAGQRNSISIISGYSLDDSRQSRVNTYRLNLGWSRFFSETFDLYAALGGRYSRVKNKQSPPTGTELDGQENSDIVIDIAIHKRGQNYLSTVGYNRDLSLSSLGEPVGKDKMYGQGKMILSARLDFLISAYLQYVRTVAVNLQTDSRYFQISPGLGYRITDNGAVRGSYSYAGLKDFLLVGGNEIYRHQASFSWTLSRTKSSYRFEYIFTGIKDFTLIGDNLIERHKVLLSWTYRFRNR